MFNSINIKILDKTEDTIEFDISNIDAPIINALRRIMIADVIKMKFIIIFY